MKHDKVRRLLFVATILGVALWLRPDSLLQPAAQVKAAPASNDTLKVAGLQAPVTVRRDERSIPYLEAANDHDLYFAQGYVTASDRLWQMDLLRRNIRGELSELVGKAAFEEDKRRRILGYAKQSEELAAKTSGTTRATMQAYADGVNAYISSLSDTQLPPEFRILKYKPRPWTIADSLAISFLMMESLSTTWQADVMRAALSDLPAAQRAELLLEFTDMDTPVVGSDRLKAKSMSAKIAQTVPVKISDEIVKLARLDEEIRQQSLERVGLHAEELAASNNWVVNGKRTASGKPLLSNDPHLAPSVPSIWYLINLSAPGVRAAGVSIPGIGAVIIGHNERIAWGMTNLGPDVQDLYLEKFDPANPARYQTPAGWQNAVTRREEIKVRQNPASPATESSFVDVTVTRHGPIVLEKGNERYALKWSLYDTTPEAGYAFHLLNRAGNWQEFTGALKHFGGATQNIIYADVDGHIGYYGTGKIPLRKSGDGSVPYDGATDDGEWTGYIPFEKLPHVLDPPSGMIVTANARVVGKDYPYHLTHGWSAPYRQKRINNLLKAKPKLTIDDYRAVLGDTYAIGGSTFAKAVVKLFGKAETEPALKEALSLLAEWDGQVVPDSRAALLVQEWRDMFGNLVVKSAIGEAKAKVYRWTNRNALLDRIVTEWPQRWLPKEAGNWQAALKASFGEARANLAQKYGADESKWTFGNAAQIRFNHPLASAPLVGNQFKIAPFPQNGNGYAGGLGPTVNVGPGVSMRLIADPSNWDKSQHGITLGQSGNPQSPHYTDQLADWRNVTPRVFPFTADAVKKAAKQTVTLTP
jgi:penicillin amidase